MAKLEHKINPRSRHHKSDSGLFKHHVIVDKGDRSLANSGKWTRLTPIQIAQTNVIHNLGDLLSELVPSAIATMTKAKSLPSDWELFLKEFGPLIAEKGDTLQYPTAKDAGEWESMVKKLAIGIAGLSFYPGGISFCGWRYVSFFGDRTNQIIQDSRYQRTR